MFWSRIIDRLCQAGRLIVLALSLSALVLAGAFAADRALQAPVPPSAESAVENALDELGATPGSEDPVDGMAPGGRPCSEPAAYVQAAVAPPGSDNQPKLRLPQVSGVAFDGAFAGASHWRHQHFGTVAEVSGPLAHRFTLVGARPSGTS